VPVVREPGASNVIEIPPPRPKRKPLHPYPRKCADSSTMANPKLSPVSPSSGSDQENGSPVSVLSAVQSDAFGSSVSNPSTGCTSPVSSEDGDNACVMVNGEEILAPKLEVIDQSCKVHPSFGPSFQLGKLFTHTHWIGRVFSGNKAGQQRR
jgi:hypothetical protein